MGKKALVKKETEYAVLRQRPEELQELVEANLGDLGAISTFDLPRIKLPTGGGSEWQLPTLEGAKGQKIFEAIVLAWKNVRSYWPDAFAGGIPPQCMSLDARIGIGDPGGSCRTCKFAQFGSDGRGDGQACKQMIRLLVMTKKTIIPFMLSLPPTSIKEWRQYTMKLLAAQLRPDIVVTRFTIDVRSNKDGIKYGVANFVMASELDPKDAAALQAFSQTVAPILSSTVSSEDYQAEPQDEDPPF